MIVTLAASSKFISYISCSGALYSRPWTLNVSFVLLHAIYCRGRFKGLGGRGGSAPSLSFAIICSFCNHFEELQTVIFEVKLIINNAPLIYVYPNTIETCLTPNHLLFDRELPYIHTTCIPRSYESNRSLKHYW